MTIDRIKISREVQLSSKWIAVEASLNENEDPLEGLAKLDNTIQEYLLKTGQTYFVNNSPEPPKVIDRLYERMEAIIDSCTSLEQLAKHKEYCSKNQDLMPFYMNKVKQLSNGEHKLG